MSKPNLPLHASAVLIWLPKGQKPEGSFDPSKLPKGSDILPEPWWELHQAIRYAVELEKDGKSVPWIKTGDILLPPAEIEEAYAALGNYGKP